jgi:hypothetical protein
MLPSAIIPRAARLTRRGWVSAVVATPLLCRIPPRSQQPEAGVRSVIVDGWVLLESDLSDLAEHARKP